jgi:transposase-like protein
MAARLKVFPIVPILQVSTVDLEVNQVSDSEAFRTCPYCATEGVPKLVVYPRLVAGSSTSWRCRACNRYWSDSQLLLLRAS